MTNEYSDNAPSAYLTDETLDEMSTLITYDSVVTLTDAHTFLVQEQMTDERSLLAFLGAYMVGGDMTNVSVRRVGLLCRAMLNMTRYSL